MKKHSKKTSYITRVCMITLTIILIILFFCIMLLVSQIQGTARIVNYAGLVRGKTQRIIKLEDARQPHDEMIESVSSYIKGLRYGSKELNLVRLDDKAFQSKMQELNSYFKELCDEIQLVREKGHEHTSIIDKSEHFFQICDEATGLAEAYSQEKASALSRLEQIVFVDIGGLIILIAIELVKALRYAAQNRILQSKVYLDEATGLPNKNKCEEILNASESFSEEESIAILKGLRSRYEEHHKVEITDDALEAAVKLSARYINDRFLPDKAIDLIDEASSKVRLLNYTKPAKVRTYEEQIDELEEEKETAIREEAYEKAGDIKKKQEKLKEKIRQTLEKWEKEKETRKLTVGENEVADVVAGWTKIPVKKLAEEESERLKNLENILHERVVGQEEAITAVSKAIRRGRIGLKDPKRPIGSFLFLGPTGVGKTELSKALAEAMFGTETSLIRVDMSEYMEKHSVSKMIGSPPGYVGYEEGGQLSEKVRRNPYSVILFDEIEKAHPDVFNILLQVLDDGHITDAQGRKIDFKNTIIIMTSNAGAENIIAPKRLGFGVATDAKADHEFMKGRVMEEVKRLFKPEFLNRIDEIIVFHQLTKEHMKGIADIMLRGIEKRSKEQLGITLTVNEAAKDLLIDKGYDDKYGARPLRRTIQSLLEDKMAEEILDGKLKKGVNVEVDCEEGKLTFTVKKKAAARKKKAQAADTASKPEAKA